jgi:hypothetical protein
VLAKSKLSLATPQSEVTRAILAMSNQRPVTFPQAALTSRTHRQDRPEPGEAEEAMAERALYEPRAARDVPAGSLWAFLEHRTMAEVMLDEAKNRQSPADEVA